MPYYVWKRHAKLMCILILDGQDNPHGEQEPSVPHILNPFLSNIETFKINEYKQRKLLL